MKRLATNVRVTGENGEIVVLTPGDDVPAWAESQITNPAAWVQDDQQDTEAVPPSEPVTMPSDPEPKPIPGAEEAGELVPATDDAEPDYDGMKVADLRALIEDRNNGRDEDDLIPTDGVKADLVAALKADDESA